jgi:hypothetical protein
MSEWKLFEPDYAKRNFINVFDDGITCYYKCNNIWYICGAWKGKVRLINEDRKTYINSISAWKVVPFIQTNIEYTIPQ